MILLAMLDYGFIVLFFLALVGIVYAMAVAPTRPVEDEQAATSVSGLSRAVVTPGDAGTRRRLVEYGVLAALFALLIAATLAGRRAGARTGAEGA